MIIAGLDEEVLHHGEASGCGRNGPEVDGRGSGRYAVTTSSPGWPMKQEETAFFEPSAEFVGTLVCVKGTVAGQSFSIGRGPFVIGRSSSSSLPLEQEHGVSKEHARIELQIPGFILTDLGSRNGTFVNGKRIDTIKLSDGDEIQICGCVLRMSCVPARATPAGTASRRPATSPFSEGSLGAAAPAVHRLDPSQLARPASPSEKARETSGSTQRPKNVVGLPSAPHVPAAQAGRPVSSRAASSVPAESAHPSVATIEDLAESNEATEMVSPERAAALLGAAASPFDPDKTTIALTSDPRLQAPARPRGGAVAVSGAASILVGDRSPPASTPMPHAPATVSPATSTHEIRARLAAASPSAPPVMVPAEPPPPPPPATALVARTQPQVSVSTPLVQGASSEKVPDWKKPNSTTSVVVRNALAGLSLIAVIVALGLMAPWQKQSSAGRKVPLPPRSPVDMKIHFVQQWCPTLPCAEPLAALANDDDVSNNADAVAATDPCYRECLSLDE
jgi:hypothetical protein